MLEDSYSCHDRLWRGGEASGCVLAIVTLVLPNKPSKLSCLKQRSYILLTLLQVGGGQLIQELLGWTGLLTVGWVQICSLGPLP